MGYLIAIALVAVGLALDALGKILLPRVLLGMPPGITPDVSAEYGLLALLNNANMYTITPQASIATSGTSTTLTAQQVVNGAVVLTSGASGGYTINLPATSALITALGPTIPTNSTFGFILFVQNNNVGQTGTLTAGDASTTISGTATVATNTTRVFFVAITSATTITITNVGSLTL